MGARRWARWIDHAIDATEPARGNRPVPTTDIILSAIQERPYWAASVTFLLAFGESLAVISLLLPATGLLLAVGALVGATGLPFWPILAAASLGAILGDCVSYFVGHYFKDGITRVWPLSRHPESLRRAEALFRRWGIWAVFIGRFFGPLRALVPLAAGIASLPMIPFQIANITSAVVWAFVLLTPGTLLSRWF